MSDLQTILEQLQLYGQQFLPAGMTSNVGIAAVVVFTAGCVTCVLGAKLAKVGITGAFVVIGTILGVYFAKLTGFATAPCLLVGAATMGVIGALSQRIWVGALFALVLSGIVMSAFGMQRIVPHVQQYDPVTIIAQNASEGVIQASVAEDPEAIQAGLRESADYWLRDFWSFVIQKDASVSNHVSALLLATAVIGAFIGVIAVRFALIASTSMVGTVMILGSLATFLQHANPDYYIAGYNHPGLIGTAFGVLVAASMIVQTILTRESSSSSAEASEED